MLFFFFLLMSNFPSTSGLQLWLMQDYIILLISDWLQAIIVILD